MPMLQLPQIWAVTEKRDLEQDSTSSPVSPLPYSFKSFRRVPLCKVTDVIILFHASLQSEKLFFCLFLQILIGRTMPNSRRSYLKFKGSMNLTNCSGSALFKISLMQLPQPTLKPPGLALCRAVGLATTPADSLSTRLAPLTPPSK